MDVFPKAEFLAKIRALISDCYGSLRGARCEKKEERKKESKKERAL